GPIRLAWRTAAPIRCAGPPSTPGEDAGAIRRFRDCRRQPELRRPIDERKMNHTSAPAASTPAVSRAPARFADPTRARQVAEAFDVRQLPADYYVNPYPYYHALREHAP